MLSVIAGISFLIWLYLTFARGNFWTSSIRDSTSVTAPAGWPAVAIVIPARNEAASIGASVASLMRQDYRGSLRLVVVDDDSDDGTADLAKSAAMSANAEERVTVISSHGLPSGWTGKMWAVHQGIETAEATAKPEYFLLTDADIVHAPDVVSWLVAKAEEGRLVLTSLLAKLRCESLAERIHVPAFVFFFEMLYPFAWVQKRSSAMAAAAGGCMLVRADALARAGKIESMCGALIDDCTLAKKLKAEGPIWLGLTDRVQSLRAYETFSDVAGMISRSAYAQLKNSPLLLALTIVGLAITFLVPPFAAIFGSGLARYLGVAVWAAMALLFQPTLRFYRVSPLWGVALPAIALLYSAYTLDSAYRHIRKRGGGWKGRVYADALKPQ